MSKERLTREQLNNLDNDMLITLLLGMQEQEYARNDVNISRQTMANWVITKVNIHLCRNNICVYDRCRLACFLKFEDDKLPEVYIIPATAWQEPNAALVDRSYDKPGQKSKPEWGISYTNKNKSMIEKYKADNFFT